VPHGIHHRHTAATDAGADACADAGAADACAHAAAAELRGLGLGRVDAVL
jgi:hypothetical protein